MNQELTSGQTGKTQLISIHHSLIFLCAVVALYTIYLAKSLLLPVSIAAFISLCSSPVLNWLAGRGIPRPAGSIAILTVFVVTSVALFLLLLQPGQQWANSLPNVAKEMNSSLSEATKPIAEMGANSDIEKKETNKKINDSIKQSLLFSTYQGLAATTPILIGQILATIFMIYFFLTHGKVLLLRFVSIQTTLSRKKECIRLIIGVQKKLSIYLFSITAINIGLGICVAAVFYFIGVEDPLLWGLVATLLNFVPYIGPLVATLIFSFVGYIQFGEIYSCLLLAGTYLVINLIECQIVTPSIVGSTLNINPLIVFIWLIVCGWIWGAFGMLVGLPILVCLSMFFDNSRSRALQGCGMLIKNRRF